jgi:hypothetical protein
MTAGHACRIILTEDTEELIIVVWLLLYRRRAVVFPQLGTNDETSVETVCSATSVWICL